MTNSRFMGKMVNMEDIKGNISHNLCVLRKNKKLTQQDLAKIINYSDKAISRWELGESLPDISVLLSLCEFYNVDFDWLIHKHETTPEIKSAKTNNYKIMVIILFAVCCYTLSTVLFVYELIAKHTSNWVLFVACLPVIFFVATLLSKRWWKKSTTYTLISLTLWTFLTTFFLWYNQYGLMWPLFLVGIPLQAIFILLSLIKKEK